MTTIAIALTRTPAWVRHSLLVLGTSLLIGLLAHLAIPLPFSPVPIILQNGAILLAAVLLGSRRAAAAVALFLLQGIAGIPVFSLGTSGIACLLGPKGGYLMGYLLAAILTGFLAERRPRTLLNGAFALLAGHAVIYLSGFAWLSLLIGPKQALWLGVLPFLLGDVLKLCLSLKLLQWFSWDRSGLKKLF